MNMHNLTSGHISDEDLFEYLDQQLTDEQIDGIENHLGFCPSCAQRLGEHNALFSKIEGILEEDIAFDLTPGVLSAIKKQDAQTRIWWWLLIFQGIIAIGLMVFAMPSIFERVAINSTFGLGRENLSAMVANLSFWVQEWLSLTEHSSKLFRVDIPLALNIPLPAILWLLLMASITWIVGNSILLRSQPHQIEP